VPGNTPNFVILNENFISRGFGLTTSNVDGNRQAVWSIRRARGVQTLYYRVIVQSFAVGEQGISAKQPEIQDHGFTGAELEVANTLLQQAQQQSADLETLVALLIGHVNSPAQDDNITFLLKGDLSLDNRIQLVTRLLALAGVPTRLAHGLRLAEQRGDAAIIPWLQVYENKSWRAFDPVAGQPGMPDDYLIFWYGPGPMVKLSGADRPVTDISIALIEREAIAAAAARRQLANPVLEGLSLSSLPLDTQNVYRILLMVPVGALLVVLMRNIIGISTFGTFMPVLIALSFRETQLLWGLLLFSLVVTLGLAIRFYLDKLKLLLVPRLASVLTIVILLMVMISVLTNHFGLESGLSVALFPMVIITMTIERMSIVWDERGAWEALQQGIGSLLTAALAFLFMNDPYLKHLFTVFPELLLVLLAVMMLLGRYSGYRLLELRRFRALAQGIQQ
jgi:hypothetical protein